MMKPVVLEFSCRDSQACMASFGRAAVGSIDWHGLLQRECSDLVYTVSFEDLKGAFEALASDPERVESVTARLEGHGVAFVYRPNACGSRLGAWLVSIELETEIDATERFEKLLSESGIDHVSLSREEPLELDELFEVNVRTFPWAHWRLIRAAVRDGDAWVTS